MNTKNFKVMTSESELEEEIRWFANCWGCYTQNKDGVRYIYFDSIGLNGLSENEKNLKYELHLQIVRKLYKKDNNELRDEIVAKINNGEIFTVVIAGDPIYGDGDVSFFKVGSNYAWTFIKQDYGVQTYEYISFMSVCINFFKICIKQD
jgi:hypothetical protein